MNDIARTLSSWFVTGDPGLVAGFLIVAKVMALFSAAALLLWTMRRASASSRHLVIGFVLAASLALPLMAVALPAWEIVPFSVGHWASGNPAAVSARQADVDPASSAGASGVLPRPLGNHSGIVQGLKSHTPAKRTSIDGTSLLVGMWGAVAGSLLILLIARAIAMQRIIRRAHPIEGDDWLELLQDSKRRLPLKRPVELRRGGGGQMPLVWGTRQPVILLPAECDTWSVDRRRAVLAHELAHIARRDIPVLLIGKAACAMHWFNPLAWWLGRRLSAERERACDDAALHQGVRASLYAEQLLQVAVSYGDSRKLAPLMAAQSELEGRIMAILDSDRNRRRTSRTTRAAMAAVILLALVPLAAATGTTRSPLDSGNDNGGHAQSDSADFDRQLSALGYAFADVDTLLGGLSDESALTRAACAWRLGALGDPRAVEPLIVATRDIDVKVRQWAIRSLSDLSDLRAVQPFVERLGDDHARVREWAARSLGDLGDKRAVQPLIDSLADTDSQVREWAARSLGDLGDKRAVQPLIDSLADTDSQVREWAARSLGDLGDKRAVQPLIDSLADTDSQVREWAARSLGDLGDKRAVQPLIDSLADTDPQVREWAARSLGELKDDRAMQPLIDRLQDENDQVREWAARALGDFGEPSHRKEWNRRHPEPLMPGLESRHIPREAGDPRAITELIRALDSDDAEVREWAIRSLGNLDDGRSVVPLIDRLGDPDGEVREWASRVLGQIGDTRAVLPLIDAVRDNDSQVREWATRSLGLLQDERMVLPLIDGLADRSSQVREWSVRALGAYGDPRAVEPISRMLHDEDSQVRRWAERALESMNRAR